MASSERARVRVSVSPTLRRLVLLGGLAAAGWIGLSLVSGATAGAAPSDGQPESSANVATSSSTPQQQDGAGISLLDKGIGGAVDTVTKTVDTVAKPVQEAVAATAEPKAETSSTEPAAKAETPATQGNSSSVGLPVVDQLGESDNAVGKVTAPVVKPVLDAAKPVTKPVAEAVKPVTKPVDQAVRQVTESVDPVVEKVTKPLKPVTKAVAPVTEAAAEKVVEPVAKTAAPVVEKVSKTVVKPVAKAVEPVTDPVTDQVVKPAVDAVSNVTGDVSDQVDETVPDLEVPDLEVPDVVAPGQPAEETEPESNTVAPVGDSIARPAVTAPSHSAESPVPAVPAAKADQRQTALSVPAPVQTPSRLDVEPIAVPTPEGYDSIAAVVGEMGPTDSADRDGQSNPSAPQQPAPAQPAAPGHAPAPGGGSSSANGGAGSGPSIPVACTSDRWAVGLTPTGVADHGGARSLKGDATKPPVSPA